MSGMMNGTIDFQPLLPLWGIAVLGILMTVLLVLAIWRGLAGWAFRALAALLIMGALMGPVLHSENRVALSDIVLMLVDESASQKLVDRAEVTTRAADELFDRLQARANTEVRRIVVGDGEGDAGTELMGALSDAMAQEPRARIAGIIALSDGRVHDMEQMPILPAPLHLLHTGRPADWDLRLSVKNAPAFAILDEEIILTLQVEAMGAVPDGMNKVALLISVDGGQAQEYRVPVDAPVKVPLVLEHGGRNVIRFTVPTARGELTDRNNSALVQINGVRDRLRVLLVSGSPHVGGRTWRNLLKSDASVDLVHFTILRPPEKQDGVPVEELSLIAFPTRELFLEKIEDFDLIIFDRYKRRGILPSLYLANVVKYVRNGGAVLIAAGPDFATVDSIYRSPLAEILPAGPTARIFEEGYVPKVSDLGARHPVTADLPDRGDWGRWMRQIEVIPERGDILMRGVDGSPLLILDRVEKGRVALLASDHAWLWDRGFEGGGPQLELLRRLAHWMMGEPELEEEALWAQAKGQRMTIMRRSLDDSIGPLVITTPSGAQVEMDMKEVSAGRFEAEFRGDELGLYRLENGDQLAVIGLGPAAPKEFEKTLATAEILAPAITPMRGGALALIDGVPALRNVRAGRPAAGRGWIGLTPRNAFETLDVRRVPLLPPWLALILSAGLILGGWLREGRR
jgi:hypothetical protein